MVKRGKWSVMVAKKKPFQQQNFQNTKSNMGKEIGREIQVEYWIDRIWVLVATNVLLQQGVHFNKIHTT